MRSARMQTNEKGMARKFKHPKAVRDYWARIKREYRARKRAQQKGG
jgi:hypothetical protein